MLIASEDRQLTLDDVQGMFVLLGGGILLAALILIIEYIKQKREKRKVAQIKIKKQFKNKGRARSVTVDVKSSNEPLKPLTAH